MKTTVWTALIGLASMLPLTAHDTPYVIAHRGASGYLPEHTLEAAAMAHAMDVAYIEQDVVLSRDGVLVVLHDIHLDTTTDVAEQFPDRHRDDGRYYAIDFDWDELSQLVVRERFDGATGKPVFAGRHPANDVPYRLSTMGQQLELIAGLNKSTGREVGWCPEIKYPTWHHAQGYDPGGALIWLLAKHGLSGPDAPIIVQCFEPEELKRLRAETGTTLPFLQLIGMPHWNHATDYAPMLTPEGLAHIATYAQIIGPHLSQVLDFTQEPYSSTGLSQTARDMGLKTVPYTLRLDSLPSGVEDAKVLWEALLEKTTIQGLFADQPDFRERLTED